MSILIKLLLPTLLSFLLLSSLVHFVWTPEHIAMDREKFMLHQQELLGNLESELVQQLLSGDFAEMHASLNELMEKRNGTWKQITVNNAEGKRLYPLFESEPVTGAFLIALEQRLSHGMEDVGVLHGVFDWSEAYRQAQMESRWIEIQVLSVFALLGIAGFVFQSYWIRRPIRHLEKVSGELAARRFDVELPAVSTDEVGSLIRAFDTMRNDLLRSQEELVLRKEQAEAANRAKSAFLANMSHELRTPLNAVLGYAQILQRDISLSQAQRQNVEIIKRSGDYLLTLINDVLDLAKIEVGRLELMPGPCELSRFFSELGNLFRLCAHDKGIAFQYQCSGTLPDNVEIDEKRLRQICMNLLGNAMKFTQQGEVRLETGYRNAELTIQVKDTGIGIPDAMHEEIFKPFRQTGEDQYKQQGTGLGLAISHNLAKQMQGRIDLESEEGAGSCFIVKLPAPVSNMAALPAAVPLAGYRRLDGETASLRILVTDDNLNNRNVLRDLLEPLGFVVSEAADGAEAVTLSKKQVFDVILMDLVMPNLDGLSATRRILARSGDKNKRIVAVTARAFEENRAECLAAGCCEYLSKPVDSEALLRVLQALLPLEWKYADSRKNPAAEDPAQSGAANTLPAEWFKALELALIDGNREQAASLLAQFETQNSELRRMLYTWFEGYEYLRLLDWIEKTNRGKQ
ncbi:MAG: response regulator [Gammaproteobacteria bacterium]|nr:response regulator [Gammaproteobacteria bacterium]